VRPEGRQQELDIQLKFCKDLKEEDVSIVDAIEKCYQFNLS
jgi:hypothetical protein